MGKRSYRNLTSCTRNTNQSLYFNPQRNHVGPNLSNYFIVNNPSLDLYYDIDVELLPTVLILTPLKEFKGFIANYINLLQSIQYPKEKISLGFYVSSDNDRILLEKKTSNLLNYYRRVEIVQRDIDTGVTALYRHEKSRQQERRSRLAKIRNYLLHSVLYDEEWVFWLDGDLHSYEPHILLRLLSSQKSIVVANCVIEGRSFDLNSFQETPESINKLKFLKSDVLLLQGYPDSLPRRSLHQLKDNTPLVKLDGVGATALLIRADLHREGLIFPPFIYRNQIETEGLAKMASDMGHQPWGMPYVETTHEK